MTGFLGAAYLWVKAAHIIFVIFWMAGLFMLPRFLAYHQETPEGAAERALWIEREQRLISIILTPSIGIVWILGILLALDTAVWREHWFQLKILIVFALSGYQGFMSGYAKKLAKGEGTLSGKTLRMLNEVPGIAAAIVVVMVIVRPF